MLALAQPAEGEIVYTPASIRINHATVLDLNHDGVNDFTFTGYRFVHRGDGAHQTYFNSSNAAVSILGAGTGNQVWGSSKYASALSAGAQIGSAGKFPGANRMLHAHDINASGFSFYAKGPWAGSKSMGVRARYLGLKFTINGQTHFGWARVNVKVLIGAVIQATITGYAYEDIANMPIQAGKRMGTSAARPGAEGARLSSPGSGSLAALAAGAPGLWIWRRNDDEIAPN